MILKILSHAVYRTLDDSSWPGAVHPLTYIKVSLNYFPPTSSVEITGPLIPNEHWRMQWLGTQSSVFSLWPHKIFPLLQQQPFVEPVYLSEAPLGSPAGKTASPDQEAGGRLIFMLDLLFFAVAAHKPILSPITFNWHPRLWNVCSD